MISPSIGSVVKYVAPITKKVTVEFECASLVARHDDLLTLTIEGNATSADLIRALAIITQALVKANPGSEPHYYFSAAGKVIKDKHTEEVQYS